MPKDHLLLIAVDGGAPQNRPFALAADAPAVVKNAEGQLTEGGVKPLMGQWFTVSGEASVTLGYPRKVDGNVPPRWEIEAKYSYGEEKVISPAMKIGDSVNISEGKLSNSFSFGIGSSEEMAHEYYDTVYQENGKLHIYSTCVVIEDYVKPELKPVDTGIEGVQMHEVIYGEAEGRKRGVVILVAPSFEAAQKAIAISDENPKFRWDHTWFHKTTDILSDLPTAAAATTTP